MPPATRSSAVKAHKHGTRSQGVSVHTAIEIPIRVRKSTGGAGGSRSTGAAADSRHAIEKTETRLTNWSQSSAKDGARGGRGRGGGVEPRGDRVKRPVKNSRDDSKGAVRGRGAARGGVVKARASRSRRLTRSQARTSGGLAVDDIEDAEDAASEEEIVEGEEEEPDVEAAKDEDEDTEMADADEEAHESKTSRKDVKIRATKDDPEKRTATNEVKTQIDRNTGPSSRPPVSNVNTKTRGLGLRSIPRLPPTQQQQRSLPPPPAPPTVLLNGQPSSASVATETARTACTPQPRSNNTITGLTDGQAARVQFMANSTEYDHLIQNPYQQNTTEWLEWEATKTKNMPPMTKAEAAWVLDRLGRR